MNSVKMQHSKQYWKLAWENICGLTNKYFKMLINMELEVILPLKSTQDLGRYLLFILYARSCTLYIDLGT